MGRVIRPGMVPLVKKANKRHQRNCRSAPEVPVLDTPSFAIREVNDRDVWRARVNFDPVTEDVAGRAITVEAYQAQLRFTDSGGTPISIGGHTDDVMRDLVQADEVLRFVFEPLPRPRRWYVQIRARALNRIHGGRCWSAWSGWTTPMLPAAGTVSQGARAIRWTMPGTLIAKSYDALFTADRKYRLIKVKARVGRHDASGHPADDGTPGGGAVTINLRHRDAEETFDHQVMDNADRLKIPKDTHKDTVWATEFNIQSLAVDEVLYVKLSSVGPTRAAKNLMVTLIVDPDEDEDIIDTAGLTAHGRGYSKVAATVV